MGTLIYQLNVIHVGQYVAEYLKENKIILFSHPVPQDIKYYCVVHQPSELKQTLQPGFKLYINQNEYNITAVGDVATENLKQLGHITLSFDNKEIAELPGMVHLSGTLPEIINPDDTFSIYSDK